MNNTLYEWMCVCVIVFKCAIGISNATLDHHHQCDWYTQSILCKSNTHTHTHKHLFHTIWKFIFTISHRFESFPYDFRNPVSDTIFVKLNTRTEGKRERKKALNPDKIYYISLSGLYGILNDDTRTVYRFWMRNFGD